jgi:hypothetical protein
VSVNASLDSSFFKKLSRQYRTPGAVQKLLRSFEYNPKQTMRSAYTTFKSRRGHCLETTFVAAAILEHRGYKPLVLSLDSQDNIGHVLFLFKERTGWGAIGRSRESGLHGRAPKFRSIRDLAWSYVDPYVDDTGGRVVAFAVLDLDSSESPWRFSPRNVWKCERYILETKHKRLRASEFRHRRVLKRFVKGGHITQDYWW